MYLLNELSSYAHNPNVKLLQYTYYTYIFKR